LIKTANDNLKKYNAITFALAAEKFVDEDLSNWYVRRVKPRLNSKVGDLDEAGLKDKWAAYHTLHTVLTTLCRLLAPCIPFVTEVMWKNLAGGTESVHLTDYPRPDELPSDRVLVAEMDTLRDVITLGGAARNVAKINVRQPLAELAVRVLSDEEAATVRRFDQLIRDELNVKEVIALPPSAPTLLAATAKFNAKTANAKLGAKKKDAEAILATSDARELAKRLRAGPVEFAGVPLEATDVVIDYAAAQSGYAGTADNRGREGVVSTTITEELKLEGLARNVVRQVNIARKDANLDIADSITLHLHTTADALAKAIAAHRDTIAGESQTTAWSGPPIGDGAYRTETKIDGHALVIELRKA
jgi:isoleucyl-tRNA synthetase